MYYQHSKHLIPAFKTFIHTRTSTLNVLYIHTHIYIYINIYSTYIDMCGQLNSKADESIKGCHWTRWPLGPCVINLAAPARRYLA